MTHAHTILRPRPARRAGPAAAPEPVKPADAAPEGRDAGSGIIRGRAPRSEAAPRRGVGRAVLLTALAILLPVGAAGAGAYLWITAEVRSVIEELNQGFDAERRELEAKNRVLNRRLVGIATSGGGTSDTIEARLSAILDRQVELEQRQALLTQLAEQAGAPVAKLGLVEPPAPATPPEPPPRPPARARGLDPIPAPGPAVPGPAAAPATGVLRLGAPPSEPPRPPDRSVPPIPAAAAPRAASEASPLPERLDQLAASIDRVATAQLRAIDGFARLSQGQVALVRAAISEVGLDPAVLDPPPSAAKKERRLGGLFVPVGPQRAQPVLSPFERALAQAKDVLDHAGRLRALAQRLPFGEPMDVGDALTSSFGHRSDPFTKATTFHAGLDFRGETGTPVRAAGAGKVSIADAAGGYGNLVELEHLGGVTTRYAHLSAIYVKAGENVVPGQVVGLLGSTGRSTGPHLHYETRLDGTPADPMRFLKAGARTAGPLASPD